MIRRPPRSTRTDTLFPYTTLFRSHVDIAAVMGERQAEAFEPGDARLRRDVGRAAAIVGLAAFADPHHGEIERRSEEHTSELQSLMRISYAVFCLKKKTKHTYAYEHKHLVHHEQYIHKYVQIL